MNVRIIRRFTFMTALTTGLLLQVNLRAQVVQQGVVTIIVPNPAAAASDSKPPADAQSVAPPSTMPTKLPAPTADYQLQEWAVFVAEPMAPRANSTESIKSTLPSFIASRRADAAPEDRGNVMPIGVIRILGGKTPSPKFDVLLNLKSGEFQGEWPKAESHGNRLLWNDLVADDATPLLAQVDEKHWITRLRAGDARNLVWGRDTRGERFLLYDAEPGFSLPLKVETAGENAYRVANIGSADVSDLEIYRNKPDGWHKAFVETIPASSAAKNTPATRPAEPKIERGDTLSVSVDYAQNIITQRQNTAEVNASGNFNLPSIGEMQLAGKTVEEAKPLIQKQYADRGMAVTTVTINLQKKFEAPTTAPTGPSAQLALSKDAAADPKQALADWKARLTATGLAPADTDLILDILAKYAFDSGRLTAVYMLDQKQMDDLIPEEVVPTPAKTVRVGLVIARNIDPQINDDITALVKQLGDDEWSTREAAQKKLAAFGRVAKIPLEKATHEKDMEVVWRAEAALHEIDPQRQAQ